MANPIPAASQNATLVVTHEAHRNHSSASEWDAGFQRDLAINSWTMFAIGMLLIWLRV
ncbi:hypothetical protein P152DRAFT_457375 [Eremomyces bilateralis CBS 781.70]|uniref:Uncharacterized protein n=1 Tax=Eremomyces bilateralis CBS 781.70 TaxID=1392243 RepID=A0A6G1G7W4_9PEZI|nr:uncharacterized protein P152DRAFT_457375 [Eremomyces bilateralis CBS 781.70]KAF1814011.1 hypothetical protein P152DRAFT_457375 [Eremomyces bilateralis CBS 781.70]